MPDRRAQRLLLFAFLGVFIPSCQPEPVEITLLSMNDLHGAFAPGVEAESGRPWGGAAALAALVRSQRRERTFLLDAGDEHQGTPESNFSFGRCTVAYLNRLGVDAAALGNHEFDWGIDTLRARLGEMRYPMLAANVYERASGAPPSWARGWTLVERDGVHLGVIGFITPDTPKVTLPRNVASLGFRAPEAQVDSLVALVRAAGADVVVALCHIGAVQDTSGVIAGAVTALARPGVDAIVGGHTHTFVAGAVAGVPIVIAGTKGRGLGRIVLRWDGKRILQARSTLLPVYADSLPIAPEPRVAALIDSVCSAVAPLVSHVVARTPVRLDEEALATRIADAMRRAARADVAVTNLGGVRTEFEPGDITEGAVFELVPFENTLVTANLPGAALAAFVASGAAEARVAGVRFRPGEAAGNGGDARAAFLAPDRTYRVVTNNFLAQGGDGFVGFPNGAGLEWTSLQLRDVVRAALMRDSDSTAVAPPEVHVFAAPGGAPLHAYMFRAREHRGQRAAVVIFHGGGWSSGEPAWAFDRARHLAARGMVAVAAEYRLANGETTTPVEAMADARAVLRWLRQHARDFAVDPERIAAYGWSAGGHLAVSAAIFAGDDSNDSVRATPDALVLVSPAVDLTQDSWARKLMGSRSDVASISPLAHVRVGLPPTLILQGNIDTVTPLAGAESFAARMLLAGNRCELHVYRGVGHLFTPAGVSDASRPQPDPGVSADAVRRVDAFLSALGFQDGSGSR